VKLESLSLITAISHSSISFPRLFKKLQINLHYWAKVIIKTQNTRQIISIFCVIRQTLEELKELLGKITKVIGLLDKNVVL